MPYRTHKVLRGILLIIALLGLVTTAWAGPEDEVRETIQNHLKAIAEGDAEAVSTFWAEDAQLISPRRSSRYQGRAAIEKLFARWFRSTSSRSYDDLEFDLQIYQDNIAVHAVYTLNSVGNDGQIHKSRRRATTTRVKRDGQWVIVSAHGSYVPR